MDFFEVFPHLSEADDPALKGRALRLISLAGIPYDADAYYFELSQERFWMNGADGQPLIGLGGAQVRADAPGAPLKALKRHLREAWNSESHFIHQPFAYLLEGERLATLTTGDITQPHTPQLLLFTAPRLGGGEVPDALVQAVYFPQLQRRPTPLQVPGILRIERAAIEAFLAEELWTLAALETQTWAELLATDVLPEQATLRPVLALRALQQLWRAGLFPLAS